MSQTKSKSAAEGLVNVTLGCCVGFVANKHVGLDASTSFWLTIILTIISFCRGYLVRRLFNWMDK